MVPSAGRLVHYCSFPSAKFKIHSMSILNDHVISMAVRPTPASCGSVRSPSPDRRFSIGDVSALRDQRSQEDQDRFRRSGRFNVIEKGGYQVLSYIIAYNTSPSAPRTMPTQAPPQHAAARQTHYNALNLT